ncbi:ferritin family protein [Peptostreptococcaceae bacterium AGR-M142]
MGLYDGSKLINMIAINESKIGKLYENLANDVIHEKSKNLFNKLAKDEYRHEKIYKKLLENLGENKNIELDDDEIEYVEALIQTNVLNDKNLNTKYTKEEAIMLAEQVERDGIILISQLIDMYDQRDLKEIKTILKEEKKHLKYVLDVKFNSNVSLLGL